MSTLPSTEIRGLPFDRRRRSSIRTHLAVGAAAVLVFVGGMGGWAATTEISGAVIAPGVVVVDSNSKKIQHPTGGVVGDLLVKEGEEVKAGQVLIRLDETQTKANLDIVDDSLNELYARQARLEAERDGSEGTLEFPGALVAQKADADVAKLMAGETKLYELHRETSTGEKSQLLERIAQLNEDIKGMDEQAEAKQHEIDLTQQELVGVQDLWQKKLVELNRVTELQRNSARLDGEKALLVSSKAEAKGKIAETNLQIIEVDQKQQSDAGGELADVRAKIAELLGRKIAAEDQLKRIEIRSPEDGTIHQLTAHTVGGVIQPGETLALLVPDAEALTVEAKIAPQQIDRVRMDQPAGLRFPAFNMRTTPELNGNVSLVSPDISEDPKTGAPYYMIRVAVPDSEIKRLGDVRLIPGMPVEAFIKTEDRTVISYFVKPLKDQISRAFRER